MRNQLVHTSVGDCMTPFLLTLTPYATLAEAYEMMRKNSIRRVPVVQDTKLVGIITLTDVLEAKTGGIRGSKDFAEVAESLSKVIVCLAMTPNPIVIYPTDTVGHAAELMLEHKIGGLPVVDANQELVGLITESDIFRLLARSWRDENMKLAAEIS